MSNAKRARVWPAGRGHVAVRTPRWRALVLADARRLLAVGVGTVPVPGVPFGILAGYFAVRDTGARQGVGYRVGAIGGLPGLLFLVDLPEAMTALGGPEWFIAAGTAFTIVIVGTGLLLMIGLSAVVGELGARVGGWLATRSNNRHSPATGG